MTATCNTAANCQDGLLTMEVKPAPPTVPTSKPVTYSFVASQPGTYLYHSGTQASLQKDMGLVGAIIVRPTGFDTTTPPERHPPTGKPMHRPGRNTTASSCFCCPTWTR